MGTSNRILIALESQMPQGKFVEAEPVLVQFGAWHGRPAVNHAQDARATFELHHYAKSGSDTVLPRLDFPLT
jgi:hypothetical protein